MELIILIINQLLKLKRINMSTLSISEKIDFWLAAPNYYSFIDKVNDREFSLSETEYDQEIVNKHGHLKSAIYYLDKKASVLALCHIQNAYNIIHASINETSINPQNVKKLYSLVNRLKFVELFLDCTNTHLNEIYVLILKINEKFKSSLTDVIYLNLYPKINRGSEIKIINGNYFLNSDAAIGAINKIAHQHFASTFHLPKELRKFKRQNLNYSLFLAMTEKKIVGFVLNTFNNEFYVTRFIALDTDFRGKDLGTKLLFRTLKDAQDNQKNTVSLSYWSFSSDPFENVKCEIRTLFYNNFFNYGVIVEQGSTVSERDANQKVCGINQNIDLLVANFDFEASLDLLQKKIKTKKIEPRKTFSEEKKK